MQNRSIVPLAGEVWKDIPSTYGFYQASSQGRIRRVQGWQTQGYCTILTLRNDTRGYPCVRLKIVGKVRRVPIHRLVAEAFLGRCPNGLQVNHKDGQKWNSSIENLEYVTCRENIRHAYRTGLMSAEWRRDRKLHGCSSKFVGVKLNQGKWNAQIGINGRRVHLGCFNSEHRAALAYLKARVEHELGLAG